MAEFGLTPNPVIFLVSIKFKIMASGCRLPEFGTQLHHFLGVLGKVSPCFSIL